MDMRSTGIVGSSRNFESSTERSVKGTRPSIRSDGIPLAQSIFVRMSRVDRHDVKTMLDILRFNECSYFFCRSAHLLESVSKHDLWILSVTATSLEEYPSGNPNGDGLGEAIEKELGPPWYCLPLEMRHLLKLQHWKTLINYVKCLLLTLLEF
jgi:hypothetical protein